MNKRLNPLELFPESNKQENNKEIKQERGLKKKAINPSGNKAI